MTKRLIIPGLNGSGPDHWQTHWLADIENAELVEQENWHRPSLKDWLSNLESALVGNPGSVLIAHSLGAILVARLAQSAAADHVAGALLVAPCDISRTNRLHNDALQFGTMPVGRLPFPSIVVASRNDPYMSIAAASSFASMWGSGFVDIGNAGHINVASGFGRWEEGYVLASGFERTLSAGASTTARRASLARPALTPALATSNVY
jgi:predicted alpha/beta hydrolase family esterase